jgi:hypothetical protein
VVRGAGHKRSEIEVSRPDSPAVRRADEDVAVRVGYEDLVPVVAPLEVADWGAPVVDELHHRAAVVVAPDDDRSRRVARGDLVEVFVPLYNGHLGRVLAKVEVPPHPLSL